VSNSTLGHEPNRCDPGNCKPELSREFAARLSAPARLGPLRSPRPEPPSLGDGLAKANRNERHLRLPDSTIRIRHKERRRFELPIIPTAGARAQSTPRSRDHVLSGELWLRVRTISLVGKDWLAGAKRAMCVSGPFRDASGAT
jgi:hypothetical protein